MFGQASKRNLLKKFLVLSVTAVCTFANLAPVQGADDFQFYNYDLSYYFFVPAEYEKSVSNMQSNNVNVQFNDNVYMFVRVTDWYKDIPREERGGYSRADYDLDGAALDSTYNNEDFLIAYFQTQIQTLIAQKAITSIVKQTLNGSTFWVCSYTTYTETYNIETAEYVRAERGEGKLYLNITNGYIYFIILNCTNGKLSDTPAAQQTLDTFTIGTFIKGSVYFMWTMLILFLLAIVFFILRWLDVISIEEYDEYSTIRIGKYAAIEPQNSDGPTIAADKEALQAYAKEYQPYDDELPDGIISIKGHAKTTTAALPRLQSAAELAVHEKRLQVLEQVENLFRTPEERKAKAQFEEERKLILEKVDTLLSIIKNNETENKEGGPQPETEKTESEEQNQELTEAPIPTKPENPQAAAGSGENKTVAKQKTSKKTKTKAKPKKSAPEDDMLTVLDEILERTDREA